MKTWVLRLRRERAHNYAVATNVLAQITVYFTLFWTHAGPGQWLILSFALPSNLLLFWYLRSRDLRLYTVLGCALGMLYAFAITWLEGGIWSSSVSWFILLPLAVHHIAGPRQGLWVMLLSVALISVLAVFNHWGWSPHAWGPTGHDPAPPAMSFIDFFVVAWLIYAIPWMYSLTFEEHIRTLDGQQRDLEHKQQELEHAERMRDRFIATVSHELRTPMNAILGLNHVLLQRAQDLPEALKVLKYTQQSADHLMTVINDVLDYSQFASGQINAHLERTPLHEVAQAAYELFVPRTQSLGLDYRCELALGVPQWVMTDRHRLMQILVNLLGNAIKFTAQGGVSLQVRATATGVEFAVQDSGIGIASDKLEKIFERYTQEDDDTHTRFGGTGLGLTISRKLVALLGGRLQVSSTLGQGSRFWFELPLQEQAPVQAEASAAHSLQQAHSETAKTMRFLVVDDHAVNRQLIKLVLSQQCAGCQIAEAQDGQEALALVAQQSFDLVIMDMVMPNVDGIEATRLIRGSADARVRQLPILGLTANVTQNDLLRFKLAGVDEILLKPLQIDRLTEHLQQILQRAR